MIDIRDEDVVLTRRTQNGRFVLFTSTDVLPGWPLPWWGAIADTGGDGHAILVRLDSRAAPEGWTASQLLQVARGRIAAEAERRPIPVTRVILAGLDLAMRLSKGRFGGQAENDAPVQFRARGGLSPYPWTVASQGGVDLPLCPDPESLGEGVTPEQLLIILEQLLIDAIGAGEPGPHLPMALHGVACALEAERRRLADLRGPRPPL